jgi:hypothetical protein
MDTFPKSPTAPSTEIVSSSNHLIKFFVTNSHNFSSLLQLLGRRLEPGNLPAYQVRLGIRLPVVPLDAIAARGHPDRRPGARVGKRTRQAAAAPPGRKHGTQDAGRVETLARRPVQLGHGNYV